MFPSLSNSHDPHPHESVHVLESDELFESDDSDPESDDDPESQLSHPQSGYPLSVQFFWRQPTRSLVFVQ